MGKKIKNQNKQTKAGGAVGLLSNVRAVRAKNLGTNREGHGTPALSCQLDSGGAVKTRRKLYHFFPTTKGTVNFYFHLFHILALAKSVPNRDFIVISAGRS